MTERVMSGLERWSGRIVTFCAVGTCLCLAGLAYLQVRTGGLASDGAKARVTQCQREPVIHKLIVAGAHYHLLSPADVKTFRKTAPQGCPP
jgi:hypothetical protein